MSTFRARLRIGASFRFVCGPEVLYAANLTGPEFMERSWLAPVAPLAVAAGTTSVDVLCLMPPEDPVTSLAIRRDPVQDQQGWSRYKSRHQYLLNRLLGAVISGGNEDGKNYDDDDDCGGGIYCDGIGDERVGTDCVMESVTNAMSTTAAIVTVMMPIM
jgi:hypothetical protein